ncbi:MAG: diadenosine tetraphosphatase [Cycloclasticus sp. symbiont of Bathymodiolus heckerae]|nr:MAG: diadenosine tetraphosphatase [Cycloclasticus sp. symbiont of Bathymodiolus heckerae]
MTTYAIGDIQGCYDSLRELLDKIQFDQSCDQLWFAGDLINRGPQSLDTLRFIISLGDNARSILGNHECHFLAVARGHKKAHRMDTFSDILKANDADELIQWLRSQPFFYEDTLLGYSMLHAGLPPQWSINDARQYARELEAVIQGDEIDDFLSSMYGDNPNYWDESLSGNDRMRFIINCFTRLRFCSEQGRLNLIEKGSLGTQAEGLIPWFDVPNRKTANDKILFGHWSTLGIQQKNNTTCLDGGCLWGGSLAAIKLDGSDEITSVDCKRYSKPN